MAGADQIGDAAPLAGAQLGQIGVQILAVGFGDVAKEMIVAGTARAAGQGVPLIRQHHVGAHFGGPDGGHQPGDAAPDDQHIGLNGFHIHDQSSSRRTKTSPSLTSSG